MGKGFVLSTQRSTPHKFAQELERMFKNGMSSEELDEKINQVDGLRPGCWKESCNCIC